jgi:hypothetical protein
VSVELENFEHEKLEEEEVKEEDLVKAHKSLLMQSLAPVESQLID